jgi:toxin FitB
MLLDSHIIIYAAQSELTALRQFIPDHTPAVSVISSIEVLGDHRPSEEEQQVLERFFRAAEVLSLSKPVAQ